MLEKVYNMVDECWDWQVEELDKSQVMHMNQGFLVC